MLIVVIPLIFMTVSVHEFCHGYVAYRLGDLTAKKRGRLTLNPLKHISLKFTLLLPIVTFILFRVGIALAKPVPINPLYFKNPRRGLIWVGLAGPCANLVLAALLWVILRSGVIPLGQGLSFGLFLRTIIALLVLVNLLLAGFNLLPIPPLDGSKVLVGLMPYKPARFILRYERYGLFFLAGAIICMAIFFDMEKIMMPVIELLIRFLRLDQFAHPMFES